MGSSLTPRELESAIFRALRRTLLLGLGLYVLLLFLDAVTFLILFFGLVFLVAAALNPVVAWMQRHHIPRPAAAAAIGLVILLSLVLTLWLAVPPLLDQGQQLISRGPQLWNTLRDRIEGYLSHHPELAAQVPTADQLVRTITPLLSRLPGRLGQYTLNVVSVLASLILLVVLVVYSLASPQPLIAGLLGAVPEAQRSKAERILGLVLARIKAWAMGSLLLGLIVGVMSLSGLYFLHMPYALIFAVIAAVGELLPNLGPLLSAIPPIFVALSIDPMLAVWVGVLFFAVQQLENHLVVPLVMSRTLDLHPLSVTFMVLVLGTLYGAIGAIIAVPATVVIKTLYQELYLARQVHDVSELEARSERVLAEEAQSPTQSPTENAPTSSSRRRSHAA